MLGESRSLSDQTETYFSKQLHALFFNGAGQDTTRRDKTTNYDHVLHEPLVILWCSNLQCCQGRCPVVGGQVGGPEYIRKCKHFTLVALACCSDPALLWALGFHPGSSCRWGLLVGSDLLLLRALATWRPDVSTPRIYWKKWDEINILWFLLNTIGPSCGPSCRYNCRIHGWTTVVQLSYSCRTVVVQLSLQLSYSCRISGWTFSCKKNF